VTNRSYLYRYRQYGKKIDLQKIITIIDGKSADIETIDNTILMETVGVVMAIDKLRESLDKVESHLDDREFEKASHVGYQDVAHNFVYVQRTLAGLQTAVYQKEALIVSTLNSRRKPTSNLHGLRFLSN
jgi:hypothetical protein